MTAGAPPQRPRLAWIPWLTSATDFMVVAGTLGVAAASWIVTARQMRGMHMGLRPTSARSRSSWVSGCR